MDFLGTIFHLGVGILALLTAVFYLAFLVSLVRIVLEGGKKLGGVFLVFAAGYTFGAILAVALFLLVGLSFFGLALASLLGMG